MYGKTSPMAADAVDHDVVCRPCIKVSVSIVVGAPLDVAVTFDHLFSEVVLYMPLPIRNL